MAGKRHRFLNMTALAGGMTMLPLPYGWFGSRGGGAAKGTRVRQKKDAARLCGNIDWSGKERCADYAVVVTGYLCLDPSREVSCGASMPPLAGILPLVFQDRVVAGRGEGAPECDCGLDAEPGPEFGDTMFCNGTAAPVLEIEPKRVRLMLINACASRLLNINILQVLPGCEVVTDGESGLPAAQYRYDAVFGPVGPVAELPAPGPRVIQVGGDGGYLPDPVSLPATTPTAVTGNIIPCDLTTFGGNLLLGGDERADLIVDFTNYPPGTEFVFYNDAPCPFPKGSRSADFFAGNPATPDARHGSTVDTRNILRIRVRPLTGSADPQLDMPLIPPVDPPLPVRPGTLGRPLPIPRGAQVRDLVLHEEPDAAGGRFLLGVARAGKVGKGFGMQLQGEATEEDVEGAAEVWRIFNTSSMTQPLHFRRQECQVMSRQPFSITGGVLVPGGVGRGPRGNERGWKGTVLVHPGEVTTLFVKRGGEGAQAGKRAAGGSIGAAGAGIANAGGLVWSCPQSDCPGKEKPPPRG